MFFLLISGARVLQRPEPKPPRSSLETLFETPTHSHVQQHRVQQVLDRPLSRVPRRHDCFARERHAAMTDSLVCNGEKLVTGSTSAFVLASERFLNSTVFQDGTPGPSVILAPSNLEECKTAPNLAISVSSIVCVFGVCVCVCVYIYIVCVCLLEHASRPFGT